MIEQLTFYMLASVTVAAALGVVLMRQTMHSALCLGLCFAAVAGIFASLGSDFIFGAQILVYVGGIAVLILFVVLLAGRRSDLLARQMNEQWLGGAFICLIFLWSFGRLVLQLRGPAVPLGAPAPTTRAIAGLLLGDYAVPFEMISVILLAAMAGAVIFGRRKADL